MEIHISGMHGRSAYLDMEFSDVISLGDLIALKLRFGWDTGKFTSRQLSSLLLIKKFSSGSPHAVAYEILLSFLYTLF